MTHLVPFKKLETAGKVPSSTQRYNVLNSVYLSVTLPTVLPLTGKLMNFTDNTGEQRAACLISEKLTKRLPLLLVSDGTTGIEIIIDPKINVDVQIIDRFIKTAKSVASVDLKRVYMSGWSNGAAMAVEYGLNTPNIAVVAAYSAPDPYRDIDDPCTQKPYPPYLTPFKNLYNQCDVIAISTTDKAFISDLVDRYPSLIAKFTVTDAL
ncbi:unnamed protein product, partial [Didymodactylos carnosus]